MAPKAKRARLDTTLLIGARRLTIELIHVVLRALPAEWGCPIYSKKSLRYDAQEAADSIYDDDLEMALQLPLKDGTSFEWKIARPQGVLRKFTACSDALKRALRAKANSVVLPWHMVQYIDEVTAGNLLAPVHSRSFYAFRFSFREFGRFLLTNACMWFEYGILRTTVVERVVGGISRIWAMLNKLFFMGHESFSRMGVNLDLGEGQTLFYARNSNLIADAEALQAAFSLRGSSSMSPCIKCSNCVMKGALTDPDFPIANPDDELKEITTPTLSSFVAATNEGIYENADELLRMQACVQRKEITAESFKFAQMAVGITHCRHSILLERPLRRVCPVLDMHTNDWVHIFLCKGVGGDEIFLVFQRMKESGWPLLENYDAIQEECQRWNWPCRLQNQGKNAHLMFSAKRAKANKDGWKSSASEFLLACPIVLYWLWFKARRHFPAEVDSFEKLCATIDYIIALKNGVATSTQKLQALYESYFANHIEVYGGEHVKPKGHDALHLSKQIDRDDGIVFDTTTNERSHQTPKGFGEIMKNLPHFEKFCLCRSLAYQLRQVQEFDEYPKLVGESIWKEELGSWVAQHLEYQGLHVSIGDIIITHHGEFCEVQACCQCNRDLFILAYAFETVQENSFSAKVCRRDWLRLVWIQSSNAVTVAKCWKDLPRGELRILKPII